jgi:hypothetical protein
MLLNVATFSVTKRSISSTKRRFDIYFCEMFVTVNIKCFVVLMPNESDVFEV